MTSPDTASYLGRSLASDEDRPKLPWVKFSNEGDAYTVTVTDKGMAPDYEYSKNPDAPRVQKTWPDGQPKEFMVVTGTLEDGTEVNVPIKGKLMTQAVGKAVVEAGKKDVDPGGKLWIKFTGWTTSKNGYDAKAFTAKYQPPSADTSSFLGTSGDAASSEGGLRAPAGKAAATSDAPPF